MGEKPLEYSKIMTFEDHIDNLNDDEIEDILIEFKKWRSSPDSSNVDKIMYNDESYELVIKFNDGSTYTYFNVDFDMFRDVFEGNASCVSDDTSGEGRWWVGKTPSVGAAVYKILTVGGVAYVEGGSLK
jgi:hypothetical protein